MSATLGDGPIEDAYVAEMNDIARAIDYVFNGKGGIQDRAVGFVLLVFPFGSADGRCNYISNGADRADIAKLLREQAARFEADL